MSSAGGAVLLKARPPVSLATVDIRVKFAASSPLSPGSGVTIMEVRYCSGGSEGVRRTVKEAFQRPEYGRASVAV